jgi:hypothetical protein
LGTIERPNGKNAMYFLMQYLFNSSGKVTGALSVLTDITESKSTKALEMRNKELADYKYALDETSIVGITNEKE